jgi:hypothetical protein
MADYVLPSVVEKRVRYFDGQFLQDQDFIDEQDYQLDREHRHNRLLHGPGIVEGLAVTSAAPNQVTVAPGTAIDSDGRQLVLAQATTVDLPVADFNDKQGVEVLISYLESAEDPQTVGGSQDFTRWLERPTLIALAPGDSYSGATPPVLLANVALDHSGRVAVDSTVRAYAGLLLPGAGADAITLRATSGGPVELAGSLTVDGSVGVGAAPAHPLHLAVGKALRIEAGSGSSDSAAYFSFGGNGAFSVDAPGVVGGRFVVQNSGNVGVGTANPTAKLEVAGGGGTSVDLVVNGRLRSNNNDGGLWVASDRFVGGFDTNKIGFYTGNAWQFAVLPNGNVGIGELNPAYPLHLSVGKALRIEGGTGSGPYFSFGGNGAFSIDAPGVVGGRFVVQNSGNVGVGTANPGAKLTVSSDDAHLQLRREPNAAAGTKIYLELFQDNSPNAVYPCLRFHHSNVFWHRIEGRPEGLAFKTGNPNDQSLVNVIANTAVLNSITIGNVTIGQNELAILQKLAAGNLQFDLLNLSHNEYVYAASDGFNYDGDRRRIFCWIPGGQVGQGRWQITGPS